MDILKKMFQSSSETNHDRTQDESKVAADNEDFNDLFAQTFLSQIEKHIHQFFEPFRDIEDDADDEISTEYTDEASKILGTYQDQHSKIFKDMEVDSETKRKVTDSFIQSFERPTREKSENVDTLRILPPNVKKNRTVAMQKLDDEEIIMGRMHGSLQSDGSDIYIRPRIHGLIIASPDMFIPMTPVLPRSIPPFVGENNEGPQMFGKSIVTRVVRKPDGSYERTQITQDTTGKKVTTVTRSTNGKDEVVTSYVQDDANIIGKSDIQSTSDRNIFLSKKGYFLPINMF